jgi:hypothetical protein
VDPFSTFGHTSLMPATEALTRDRDPGVRTAGRDGKRRDRKGLVPLLAAVAIVVVVAASALPWLTTTRGHSADHASTTANGLPAAIPTASAANQRVVTQFIQRLRGEASDFSPVADWSGRRLVLAVRDPASYPWPGVDGDVVGGLHVIVLRATVSLADYDHAISTIGRSTFVDSNTIQSYDYPTDGSHMIVRVRGLAAMDEDRRAALAANLERVSGVPVELIHATRMISLVGHGSR